MAIFDAQGRTSDFLDIGEMLVISPIGQAEIAEVLRTMARSASRSSDAVRAEETWRRLLAQDEADGEALTALEALYRQQGNAEALVEILERRAARLDDSTARATLSVEIGRIRAQQLGDPDGAINAFEEAVEFDPACDEALTELEMLYTAQGMAADLARILTRRLDLAQGSDERVPILLRLGEIAERDLDDAEMAIGRYEGIVALEPGHASALDALIRLYEAAEKWDRLALLVEQRAKATTDANGMAALLARAAELWDGRLGDTERAKGLLERVLQIDPSHRGALTQRAHLLERVGDVDGAIESYEALIRRAEDPDARIAAQLTLGRLYLYAKDNTGKALQIFKDIAASRPDHPEGTQRLKEVLYRRESWEALVPIIEREIERAQSQNADPKHLADLYLEIATILGERRRDTEAAYKWLRRGIELRRDHPGIVAALIDQLLYRGEKAEALPLLAWYTNWLEAKRKFPELAVASARLAALYEEKKDGERAYAAYQVASQADSRNVAVQLGLGRLAYETGRLDKALQTLQGLLLVQHELDDDQTRIQLFLTLARVCLESGDKAKARRHVARLLALDPTHAEALMLQKKLG